MTDATATVDLDPPAAWEDAKVTYGEAWDRLERFRKQWRRKKNRTFFLNALGADAWDRVVAAEQELLKSCECNPAMHRHMRDLLGQHGIQQDFQGCPRTA
jgi:hypothetical protein